MSLTLCLAGLILGTSSPTPATLDKSDEQDKALTNEERIRTLEEEVAQLLAERATPLPSTPIPATASTEDPDPDGTVRGEWTGTAFKFKSADGNFSARFGGRIHMDVGNMSTDDAWDTSVGFHEEDSAEIRRGRLYMSGTVNQLIEYKWQIDFAGATNKFKDFYLGLKDTAIGKVRAGQFKEPQSIEALTSSNYISTMERSSMNALVANRNLGVQVSNHNEAKTATWALGAFKDDGSDTALQVGTGETNYSGRLTSTLYNRSGGGHLLHVGASGRATQDNSRTLRYRSRGPTAIPVFRAVDTGQLMADSALVYGLEAALVEGPLSFQAEWTQSDVDMDVGSDARFNGWYALGSWFITGEARPYSSTAGVFSRVTPKNSYGPNGYGAFEAVARVGALDLDDQAVTGGKIEDLTLGLNWYLMPNSRLMLNWIHMELGGSSDGDADVISLRWQLDF